MAAHRSLQLIIAASCVALSSCALAQRLTDHAFRFDTRRDSPNIEVLDYRYGNSKQPGARPDADELKTGVIPQRTNIIGPMLRGDSLYVKWRIKSSGEVHEDTVDLTSRLPTNITDHRIYFVVKGAQLYIYLISPDRRAENEPPGPIRMFSHLKVATIYPDQRKP